MYYVLVDPRGHYLARHQKNDKSRMTTRHLQEAMWLLHKNYVPSGFELKTLTIRVEVLAAKQEESSWMPNK